jgi:hypothetical protein
MRIAALKGAWRAVTRAPDYAMVAVAVLALGIGATTSVYAVLKTVVLNPLPYPAGQAYLPVARRRGHGGERDSGVARRSHRSHAGPAGGIAP